MLLLYLMLAVTAFSCHVSCLTCSGLTASDCLTCSLHADVAIPPGPCVCLQTYYPNPNPSTCSPCSVSCLTCSGPAASQCLTCYTHAAVAAPPGSCVCSQTFYANPNASLCASCNVNCLTCSGPAATQCTGCGFGAVLDPGAHTCSCTVGFIAMPDAGNCSPVCHPTCQTCTGGGATECASCFVNANIVGGACVCGSMTFPSPTSRVCAGCHQSCATCSGVLDTQCTGCMANAQLTGTNTCECISPFVPAPDARFCSSCDLSCSTCSQAGPSGCSSCKSFAALSGSQPNTCICGEGYFMSPPNMDCQHCSSTCLSCSGSTTSLCQSCFPNAGLVDAVSPGVCQCDSGYFPNPNVNNCLPCSPLCGNCANELPTMCLTCNPQASLVGTAPNSCQCDNGYFPDPDPQQCSPCDTTCLTCISKDSSNCLSCYPNAELHSTPPGPCFCKSGFLPFPSEANCVILNFCHATCATCATPYQDGCLSCKEHAVLHGNGPARCSCFVGFYGSPDSCSPCDSTCASCIGSGALACTGCRHNANLTGGSPSLCRCLEGTYPSPDASLCKLCPNYCKSCSSIKCFDCWDGYYLTSFGTCLPCKSPCRLCLSPTSCLTCLPSLYLNSTSQCQECANCGEPLVPIVTSPYDHKYKIEFNRAVQKLFNDTDFAVETEPVSAVNWTVVLGSELLLHITGGPWSNSTLFILVFTHVNEVKDSFGNTLSVSEVFLSPPFLSTISEFPSSSSTPPSQSESSTEAGTSVGQLAAFLVAAGLVVVVALAAGTGGLAVPLLAHFSYCSYIGTIGTPEPVSGWLQAMNLSGFVHQLNHVNDKRRRLSAELMTENCSYFSYTALPILLFLTMLLFHCLIRLLIRFKPSNSRLKHTLDLFEWTVYLHFGNIFSLDLATASLSALIHGSVYFHSFYLWAATMISAVCMLILSLFTLSISILTLRNRHSLAFATQFYSYSAVVRYLRKDKVAVAYMYSFGLVQKLLFASLLVLFEGNSLAQTLGLTLLAMGAFLYSVTVQPYGRIVLRWLHIVADLDTLLAYLLMVVSTVNEGNEREQLAWCAFVLLCKAGICLFLMPVAVLILRHSNRLKTQTVPVITLNEGKVKSMRAWQVCTPMEESTADLGGTMSEARKWPSAAHSPDLKVRVLQDS